MNDTAILNLRSALCSLVLTGSHNIDHNEPNQQYNRRIYTMENRDDDAGGPSELPRITPRNSLAR